MSAIHNTHTHTHCVCANARVAAGKVCYVPSGTALENVYSTNPRIKEFKNDDTTYVPISGSLSVVVTPNVNPNAGYDVVWRTSQTNEYKGMLESNSGVGYVELECVRQPPQYNECDASVSLNCKITENQAECSDSTKIFTWRFDKTQ